MVLPLQGLTKCICLLLWLSVCWDCETSAETQQLISYNPGQRAGQMGKGGEAGRVPHVWCPEPF